MASKLLICSASPLVVPNKANSGPLAAGFGPPSFVTLPSSSRAHSLVAKAQNQPGSEFVCEAPLSPLSGGESWHNRIALVQCPRYVRSPLRLIERPDEVEISYDMAGYLPHNTKAEITADNTLVLQGRENNCGHFVRLLSYQLPPYCYCDRSKAEAKLELGVLTIKIPKAIVDDCRHTNIPITTPECPADDYTLPIIPINPPESTGDDYPVPNIPENATVDNSPPTMATNIPINPPESTGDDYPLPNIPESATVDNSPPTMATNIPPNYYICCTSVCASRASNKALK